MMKVLKYLLIFGMLLYFSGCGMADKSASNVLRSDTNQHIINNIPLDRKVSVAGYRSKLHNGLLLAEIDIKNNEQASYDLEYKISWLDDTGFEVSKTPWLPLYINAMELKSIQKIATNPKAKSFKFYLRLKQ